MKNLRRNNSGFTLIELIVVMIIIGILVLLATPRFIRYVRDANATALTVDVKVIKDAALYKNLKAYDEVGKETGYPVKDYSDSDLRTGTATTPNLTLDNIKLLEDVKVSDWETAVQETLADTLGKKVEDIDLAKYNVGIIDPEQLSSHIRNTKYNMKDFVVVLDGPAEGEVFYTGIVEDGDNRPHVGLIAPTSKVEDKVTTEENQGE